METNSTELIVAERGGWPSKAQSTQITTREAFLVALSHVNTMVRREDISVGEAKDTLTKAEALRAWASFDRRMSADEKKDANRAMTRTILMLNKVAEREQPIMYVKGMERKNGAKLPGPTAWIMRELGFPRGRAQFVRKLGASEDRAREIISVGAHWLTALGVKQKGSSYAPLANMLSFAKNSNSLMCAMRVAPHLIPKELRRIREIKAWCEAYESTLVKIKSKCKDNSQ